MYTACTVQRGRYQPAFITSEPTTTPHHRTTIYSSEPIGSHGTIAKGRYCHVGEDIADAAASLLPSPSRSGDGRMTISQPLRDPRPPRRDGNDGKRDEARCRCVGFGTASVTFEVIAMTAEEGHVGCVCCEECVFRSAPTIHFNTICS